LNDNSRLVFLFTNAFHHNLKMSYITIKIMVNITNYGNKRHTYIQYKHLSKYNSINSKFFLNIEIIL
jgi:hypothetical protein